MGHVIDKRYILNMDGQVYSFNEEDLIRIIELDNDALFNLFKDNSKEILEGTSNRYLAYALHEYFTDEYIYNNLNCDSYIFRNASMLDSNDVIDTESININYKSSKDYYLKINIDRNLEEEILRDMPCYYNSFEKAIYIYIKMCSIFIFDDAAYAVNTMFSMFDEKHKSLKYVDEISVLNNEVVCFEFTVMYAYFLNKLGIDFEMRFIGTYEYVCDHAYLNFAFDKYLVEADPITSVLESDFFSVKVGDVLQGLKCKNEFDSTVDDFKRIFGKVYDDFKISLYGSIDMINKYLLLAETNVTSFYEKFRMFITTVISSNLKNMDLLSYMLWLRENKFSYDEQSDNITITIIKVNNHNDESKNVICGAVITINEINIHHYDTNRYFFFDGRNIIKEFDYLGIQECFSNEQFEYISCSSKNVPGIKNEIPYVREI